MTETTTVALVPPVPVTPAEGLSLLRDLTISIYAEWNSSSEPEVGLFMDCLNDILKKPLVNFDEGYQFVLNQFGSHVESSNVNDLWRVFQMTFLTELGEKRETILKEFVRMVTRVMSDSDKNSILQIRSLESNKGSKETWLHSIESNLGMLVMLCTKVYVASVIMTKEDK